MKIGIDISQIVYEGTGVARYVRELVRELVRSDSTIEFILFGSSFRKREIITDFIEELHILSKSNIKSVILPIPPSLLHVIWNELHIAPIEWFIGPVDVFWSSDWTQPPSVNARLVTTVHDLVALKYPDETDKRIVQVHKRRLTHVAKSCVKIFCDSTATMQDVSNILGVSPDRLEVVYPGHKSRII